MGKSIFRAVFIHIENKKKALCKGMEKATEGAWAMTPKAREAGEGTREVLSGRMVFVFVPNAVRKFRIRRG
ncbi:MAG: hypothetical protein JXA03_06375 [Bacteroidales bacterium]|nr:hypothetical protein [Bacteroidales bacterium]